jgi:hypothetical protein
MVGDVQRLATDNHVIFPVCQSKTKQKVRAKKEVIRVMIL